MKLRDCLLCASIAITMFAGCVSTPSGYVDATDTTTAVKNKNRMSSSDWVVISQEAGNALLTSPLFAEYLAAYQIDAEAQLKELEASGEKISTLEKMTMKKPLLMLNTIELNMSEHVDAKLLTERLREVLFNSGKVRFTTYAAGDGQTIDTATAAARQLAHDPNVKKRTVMKKNQVLGYDLSLNGSISRQTAKDGRANELSYTFMLTLTDSNTGQGVWTYTKEIKRQHMQGGLGW